MLKKVILKKQIAQKNFFKYMPAPQKRALKAYAKVMRGKRVVHVNATAMGGGVAEILKSLVPYLRALGVQSDWYAIDPRAGKKFFEVTNKIHNSLQGAPLKISQKEWKEYVRINKVLGDALDAIDCDILAIHDPQPLLAGWYAHRNKHKIYFSHIDTSSAYMPTWKKLFSRIDAYHRVVFSNREFIHGSLSPRKTRVFTPAIDPLAHKQKIVPQKKARAYLKKHGIPERCPLIVQVSRFDIWKNPLGVIEAFRLVQRAHENAHLALVGFSEAKDNPAAQVVYQDIAAVAKQSKHISLFFHPGKIHISEFTMMAQNAADVVVQNSTKEGFGLVVAEAMWKYQPVIGGPASGIKKQIQNGKNGFIVKNPAQLSEKILYLLHNPKKKKRMGTRARKTVAEKFLFPRLVLDHLRLYKDCL